MNPGAVQVLERRYRALIRLYPQRFRDKHEEGLVTTLLDGAKADQRCPAVGEAFDLMTMASLEHFREDTQASGLRAVKQGVQMGAAMLLPILFIFKLHNFYKLNQVFLPAATWSDKWNYTSYEILQSIPAMLAALLGSLALLGFASAKVSGRFAAGLCAVASALTLLPIVTASRAGGAMWLHRGGGAALMTTLLCLAWSLYQEPPLLRKRVGLLGLLLLGCYSWMGLTSLFGLAAYFAPVAVIGACGALGPRACVAMSVPLINRALSVAWMDPWALLMTVLVSAFVFHMSLLRTRSLLRTM